MEKKTLFLNFFTFRQFGIWQQWWLAMFTSPTKFLSKLQP